MKVVQINAVCGMGSTGKICMSISELLDDNNIENYIFFSSGKSSSSSKISCCSRFYTKTQALKSRVLGNYGFNSVIETKRMVGMLAQIKPDIVHLHNIHGHDCHLTHLLDYLKRNKIKAFWTFHDCWAFTGYCTHFVFAGCDRWKTECSHCPQKKNYSWLFDRSAEMHRRKKNALSGLDLTIITPSQWLADLVKQSFLGAYPVKVIHNGIDLTVFKPSPSTFREKHNIADSKFILLGVSFGWSIRKGLDVFTELAKRLDPEIFQIVLVGTDDVIDRQLPENILSIHRTNNQRELAEIYSAANLLVNPTREDNYPTVNMEAIACGTPIITFRTGGSPEIPDRKTGSIVEYNDIDAMEREIIRIREDVPYSREDCLSRATAFNMSDCFQDYLVVYGLSE